MCVLNSNSLKRATNYKQETNRTFFIPLKASAVMGVVTVAVNYVIGLVLPKAVTTLIALVIAVIIYAVCLLKFGGLTENEIMALPKGAKIYGLLKKLHLCA